MTYNRCLHQPIAADGKLVPSKSSYMHIARGPKTLNWY